MGQRSHRNSRRGLEDLLEAVYMAAEIDDPTVESLREAVAEDSAVTVTAEELEELERDGYLAREGERVLLTERGRVIAEETVRRHRLTEMLLYTLLGVDREMASEIGCKVEHGVREEMIDSVCTLLGHPGACPHGRPIPKGRCCRRGRCTVDRQVVPITDLPAGGRARVVYIQPRNHQRLHKLSSLGLNPGVEVELHRRSPAFCIRFEETELAIDAAVAGDIHVVPIGD